MGELIDFMPPTRGTVATDRRRVVRGVRVVRGTMRFALECDPRFDYGRTGHEVEVTRQGAVFRTPDLHLTLHSPWLEQHGTGVRSSFELSEGQYSGAILESAAEEPPAMLVREEIVSLFDETERFWKGWLATSHHRGRWRDMVFRSAITLKLMIYAPTGAPVAAPTAGLPEQVGGERNWDYRYTWVRDGSFSVATLLALGFTEEAGAFIDWLGERIRDRAGAGGDPLQIMYRVDGDPDLDEISLDMDGYRGSRPVRIGNGAADQFQLDIYGEMVDAIYQADRAGLVLSHDTWVRLAQTIDWLSDNWSRDEAGIWETRGGPQPFTYGRLMTWVAFDRAIRLANARGRPADLDRWRAERDAVYREIMEKGFDSELGAFVQHYGSTVLDASLLKMPLVGFIAPDDPMWLSTLNAMDRTLVSDSLVYRYDPAASPDGLQGLGGDVLDVHLLVRPGPGPIRPGAGRADRLREDAHLRQSPRAVLRGDRPHRRAVGQLPPGLQPPRADQHGDVARRSARPGAARAWRRRRRSRERSGRAGGDRGRGLRRAGLRAAPWRSTRTCTSPSSTATTTTSSSPCCTRWPPSQLARADVAFSLHELFHSHPNVEVVVAEVDAVDRATRTVTTSDGRSASRATRWCSRPARAPGSSTTPGAAEHSFPLYTIEHAEPAARRRSSTCSTRPTRDPSLVDEGALTFVVVGAGATGTEIAGALAEMIAHTMPIEYPDLDISAAQGRDGGPRRRGAGALLGACPRLRRAGVLEGRGVDIRLKTGVKEVGPGHATLSDGSRIATRTVIWGGGIAASPLAEAERAAHRPRRPRGRRPRTSPSTGFPGVYVLGRPRQHRRARRGPPAPARAPWPSSRASGRRRTSSPGDHGKAPRPFRYKDKGIMAMIGHNSAVAEVGKGRHEVDGTVAFLMWLGVHATLMTGVRPRVDAFMDWAWDYFSTSRASQPLDRSDTPRIDWRGEAYDPTTTKEANSG